MTPQSVLKQIGLSEKEISIYLANLEIGTAAASIIARKAGLARTTGYSVLSELHKKGFVSRYERANTQYFTAISGQELTKLLQKKQRAMQQQVDMVQSIIPELNALHTAPIKPPKVQYFEGIEGIQQIYEDTLKGSEVEKLAYSSAPETSGQLKKSILDYVEKRTAKGMQVRAIFPNNTDSKEYIKNDKKALRTSRLANLKQFQFKSEINIYGNKVAITSLIPPHYHGVIIESPEIAETQKAIFELAWKGARK